MFRKGLKKVIKPKKNHHSAVHTIAKRLSLSVIYLWLSGRKEQLRAADCCGAAWPRPAAAGGSGSRCPGLRGPGPSPGCSPRGSPSVAT